ncbi:MAG: cytochrome PufQ [Pseudomonadota bacterium]
MTDFTTETPAEISFDAPRDRPRTHKPPRREFLVYFAVIFLATLPLATFTWLLAALRQFRIPARGPITRAWSQARVITPMIFAA